MTTKAKKDVKTRKFTRFEVARIVGARSLQISFGAPVLISVPPDMNDAIAIARAEYAQGMTPITIK